MNDDSTLIENTHFEIKPVMEFLLSLACLEKLESLVEFVETGEISADDSSLHIMKAMRSKYSDFMLSESKCFFRNFETCMPLFLYALEQRIFDEPEILIESLKEQSGALFYEKCRQQWLLLAGADEKSAIADSGVWADHEDLAGEKLSRITLLLHLFLNNVYKQHAKEIYNSELLAQKGIYQAFLNDPTGFYSKYLKLDTHSPAGSLEIHISFFLKSNLLILKTESMQPAAWIALGCGCLTDKMSDIPAQDLTEKFIKLLGDKTRYSILKLLCKRRWYNEELALTLLMSPSTINYHLTALLEFGLVKMSREKHRMYYAANTSRISEFIQQIKIALLNQEN